MPEENRNIELDLDQDQPVEAKKVEGAWGLYEELAKAKAENGTTPPVADFGIAREADTNGVDRLHGRLNFFDGDGEQLPGNEWLGMHGGISLNSALAFPDAGGAIRDEIVIGNEAFTQATGDNEFGQINRASLRLLDQLEVGETGTITFQPDHLRLEGHQYVNRDEIKDENGDLANGIPIAEVTKIDEQLKRADDQEVRFQPLGRARARTSWYSTQPR